MVVVKAAGSSTCSKSVRVHVVDVEVAVTDTAPAPVDVEITTYGIAVDYESVTAAGALSGEQKWFAFVKARGHCLLELSGAVSVAHNDLAIIIKVGSRCSENPSVSCAARFTVVHIHSHAAVVHQLCNGRCLCCGPVVVGVNVEHIRPVVGVACKVA